MSAARLAFAVAACCCIVLANGLPASAPPQQPAANGTAPPPPAPAGSSPPPPPAPASKAPAPPGQQPPRADAPPSPAPAVPQNATRVKRESADLPELDADQVNKAIRALRAWPTKKKTTPADSQSTTVAATTGKPVPVSALSSAGASSSAGGPLNVCTWNIFRFGPKKFAEDDFTKRYGKAKIDMLVGQIKHADILALQEYFDPSLTVLNTLRDALDAQTGSKWNYSVSPRVGRVSKEQYVFLYRTEVASVKNEQVYPEPEGTDPFSREPFFTHFKVNKGKTMKEFVLGTIHTEPAKAAEETSSLIEAIAWAEKYFNLKDIMVLGDYNADCQYIRKSAWDTVRLWVDKAFTWFVPTGTDTASMNSECTFDRAVSKSDKFKAAFVPGSLKVHDFVSEYKIKVAEARLVSDHFPVCMQYN